MARTVTVAICTWNRANLLDRTLAAMQDLVIPPGVAWELLVVNNNCTDKTDEVLEKHSGPLPLRRLFEPQKGQTRARNLAIRSAQGELLIWTDDDVLVDPNWLSNYSAGFAQHPEAAYAGGTIEPWFEDAPPDWLERHLSELGGVYAVRQLGKDTRWLAPDEPVFGANMAFRTDVLRTEGFDESLGIVGNGAVRGDDVDMLRRLQARGMQGLWVGNAEVRHFIPATRMTSDYVWEYFVGYGRTLVKTNTVDARCPTLLGLPRWALAEYVRCTADRLLHARSRDTRWLRSFRRAATLRGIMLESMSRREATERV